MLHAEANYHTLMPGIRARRLPAAQSCALPGMLSYIIDLVHKNKVESGHGPAILVLASLVPKFQLGNQQVKLQLAYRQNEPRSNRIRAASFGSRMRPLPEIPQGAAHRSAFFHGRPGAGSAVETFLADQPQQILRGPAYDTVPHAVERAALCGACDDLPNLVSTTPEALFSDGPQGGKGELSKPLLLHRMSMGRRLKHRSDLRFSSVSHIQPITAPNP